MVILLRVLRLVAAGITALLAMSGAAHAQGGVPGYPENFMSFDPREVALLPAYCKHSEYFRQKVPGGFDAEPLARWRATIGPSFIHIHHYCFGLLKTNRALFLTKTEQFRTFYLASSLQEYDYVLDRVPDDFVLKPEILTKRGESYVLLGKGPVGVLDFERAIELNPTYWPPYAQTSDYYKSVGNIGKARAVLEKGLEQSPDAQALKRRLAELETPAPKSAGNSRAKPSTHPE
jgi:tetratricopeptide (TPR) repeat protein